MKANELRIGNFIKINNEIVEGIGYGVISDLYQLNKGLTNDYLKLLKHEPIPLNEKWFLKFGFSIIYESTYYLPKFSDFDVYKYDGNKCKLIYSPSIDLDCCFEYVHQLQNLYFALTGEELIL